MSFKKAGIPYARELECIVNYKEIILRHKFYADFVVYDKIIPEIKGMKALSDEHLAQTLII